MHAHHLGSNDPTSHEPLCPILIAISIVDYHSPSGPSCTLIALAPCATRFTPSPIITHHHPLVLSFIHLSTLPISAHLHIDPLHVYPSRKHPGRLFHLLHLPTLPPPLHSTPVQPTRRRQLHHGRSSLRLVRRMCPFPTPSLTPSLIKLLLIGDSGEQSLAPDDGHAY